MATIGELIEKHNEYLTFLEAEEAKFNEETNIYRVAIEVIKQAILSELVAQGVQNFKTEHGTAYQSTILSAKVDNPADFKALCLRDWSFADLRVRKESVKLWLDEHNGEKPPGVAVEFITKCNIRRP